MSHYIPSEHGRRPRRRKVLITIVILAIAIGVGLGAPVALRSLGTSPVTGGSVPAPSTGNQGQIEAAQSNLQRAIAQARDYLTTPGVDGNSVAAQKVGAEVKSCEPAESSADLSILADCNTRVANALDALQQSVNAG